MIRPLSQPFPSRWGAPVVDRVDTAIFVRTYFMNCMSCTYCHDSCCQYGADVDVDNVPRVERYAEEFERFTGIPRARWWRARPGAEDERSAAIDWTEDREFPGGRQTRTRVERGACVFLARDARGCMLHSFAHKRGLDYHEIKPMVCSLFPVTFDGGLLHPSNEIADRSLQCIDDGPTLYEGVRSEIDWYFGLRLVVELDSLAEGLVAGRADPK